MATPGGILTDTVSHYKGQEFLKMKKKLLAAGAVLGLTMAGTAGAEVPLTLSAGAAHWYFSSDRELQNMSTPWAGLEWSFGDHWAAEISYAQDDAQNQEAGYHGTKTDVTLANLGLKYYGGSYIGEPGRPPSVWATWISTRKPPISTATTTPPSPAVSACAIC